MHEKLAKFGAKNADTIMLVNWNRYKWLSNIAMASLMLGSIAGAANILLTAMAKEADPAHPIVNGLKEQIGL